MGACAIANPIVSLWLYALIISGLRRVPPPPIWLYLTNNSFHNNTLDVKNGRNEYGFILSARVWSITLLFSHSFNAFSNAIIFSILGGLSCFANHALASVAPFIAISRLRLFNIGALTCVNIAVGASFIPEQWLIKIAPCFFSPLTGQNFLYISVLNGFAGENANVSLAISYVSNLDTIFLILSFNNCSLFIRMQCE